MDPTQHNTTRQLWDVDENGSVDYEELKGGLQRLGVVPTIVISTEDWEAFTMNRSLANPDGNSITPSNFRIAMHFQLAHYAQRLLSSKMAESVRHESEFSSVLFALKMVMMRVLAMDSEKTVQAHWLSHANSDPLAAAATSDPMSPEELSRGVNASADGTRQNGGHLPASSSGGDGEQADAPEASQDGTIPRESDATTGWQAASGDSILAHDMKSSPRRLAAAPSAAEDCRSAIAAGAGGERGDPTGAGVATMLQQLLAEVQRDREARQLEMRDAARERVLEREQRHAMEAQLREEVAARDKEILRLTGLVSSLQVSLGSASATTAHPASARSGGAEKRTGEAGSKMETYDV